jgi:hypothetical protein
MPINRSTLIKLFNSYGLDYIKQIDDKVFKVYDAQLDQYALVEYGHDRYLGYTIVSYTRVGV